MSPQENHGAGLFTQLAPMLVYRAVLITVSAIDGTDRLQVNICPRLLKEGENSALTTPLSVTGTAAELDAELVAQVKSFAEAHRGLSTNLDQIQAEVAEAEKAAREEAKKKKTAGNGGKKADAGKEEKAAKPQPSNQQALSLFDGTEAEASTPVA
jgi:PRTRC genetic system protein E